MSRSMLESRASQDGGGSGGPLPGRRDIGDGRAVCVHVRAPAALGAEFALQGARMRIARAYIT